MKSITNCELRNKVNVLEWFVGLQTIALVVLFMKLQDLF